jgi:two-component system cell cycle response regulator
LACRRLKSNPATHFIPVVIITALDSPADRVRGARGRRRRFPHEAVSEVVLIARVRSLTRLKMMTDELRMRAITSLEIGMEAPERSAGRRLARSAGASCWSTTALSSLRAAGAAAFAEHTVDVEANRRRPCFMPRKFSIC